MHLVDLHVHSKYSDGRNSVEEMIEVAIDKGIEALAFAEHSHPDNYSSLKAYNAALDYIFKKNLSIHIYPAVELNIINPFKRKPKILHAVIYPENIEEFTRKLSQGLDYCDEFALLAHPQDNLFWENHKQRIFPASEFKTCFKSISNDKKSLIAVLKSGLKVFANSDAHSIKELGKGTYVRQIKEEISELHISGYKIKGEYISFDEDFRFNLIDQWVHNYS